MALFKIFKGLKDNLPKTYKDGYCYFTVNDGKMYIDTKDSDSTGRILLNAGHADTATNVAWTGITTKPSYYDAKAIKSITRSGTTFTYTCMDGTTDTFTQQDNNTTYSNATTSAAGLMSTSDKSKLDGIATGAQVNQNAFSNIIVGSTTITADTTTDTLTLVGSNVTITSDATNDKVTFAVADGTTSAKGVVQLTNSTSTTSTTTAATPNSVKSAYDLANRAKTAAATAQATADSKANASHTHNYAGSSSAGGAANSATEVYVTTTNSSTYKSYQIPFLIGNTTGNAALFKNNGIKFDVRDGTTSQNGVALLLLGDTTASGTDGNKSGGLYMYNSKGKYAAMIPAENTGNITITLPSATGTLATIADINALRNEFANGSW